MATQTTKKRTIKKVTGHGCKQEGKLSEIDKRITELHNIVTGNGTPEKGLIFQIAMFNENHKMLIESISKMSGSIDMLTEKYGESIRIANMANSAIKSYKRETESFDKGRKVGDETKEKKSVKTWRTIGGVVAILALSFTILYNTYKDARKEKREDLVVKVQKIENWMNLWDFSPVMRGEQPVLDTTKFKMNGKLIQYEDTDKTQLP